MQRSAQHRTASEDSNKPSHCEKSRRDKSENETRLISIVAVVSDVLSIYFRKLQGLKICFSFNKSFA